MNSSSSTKKHFRSIGHKLKPVVTVAQKGLTDNIRNELDRALKDHELIKVKLVAESREERDQLATSVTESLTAECIQKIGNILLLYRPAARPNPKLSNLLRHAD